MNADGHCFLLSLNERHIGKILGTNTTSVRILVEHGSARNLGDIAMIEGVTTRLHALFPQAELALVHRSGVDTCAWEMPSVAKEPECVLRLLGYPFVWRIPRLERYIHRLALCHMDGIVQPEKLRLAPKCTRETGAATLGDFCQQFDALHIVGGGDLTDIFFGNLLRKCSLIHAFADQRKPVVLTGQQLGPFEHRATAKGLRKALLRAGFVGVREPVDSLAFCRKWHLEPHRFALMGDDSFGLAPAEPPQILETLGRYGLSQGRFLAVNIRVARYAAEHAKHLGTVAKIIGNLVARYGMPALVVPVALGPADSDITAGMALRDVLGEKRLVVMKDELLTPGLVKGVTGCAFGAVGVSYHFCTFALTQGVPAVCIHDGAYYSQKARGLSAFWEDGRLALELRNAVPEVATAQIARTLEDDALRMKLADRSVHAVSRWQGVFDANTLSQFSNSN